jgi:hypothetical protein
MRERDRDIIQLSGKYITIAKPHFQPREIPHSTKTIPINSALKNVPNPYCCTTSFVPRFLCPQSTIRIVSYGPENTNRNPNLSRKPCLSLPRFPCQIRTVVQNCTGYTDPYSTASHNRKIIRPKNHRKFFLGFVP